jgi:hypothetical protein
MQTGAFERPGTGFSGLRRAIPLAALVLLAGLAAPASGQYVLDRNLQQGSGGLNPRGSDLAAELRFRNAVVTGNAPGGLSFRGNVGYQAPGEFAGRVGADDTFSFRRDTVYSGMGGMGIRGTDALQYQFALTTGMAPPPGFLGTPATVGRTGAASTAGGIRTEPLDLTAQGGFAALPPRWTGGDTAADVRGLTLSALRSPAAFATTRTFQPTVLGMTETTDGTRLGVTASVLRGVAIGPVVTGRELERGQPGQREIGDFRPGGEREMHEAPEGRIDMAIDPGRRTTYEELLERMRGRETGDEQVPPGAADPAGPEARGWPQGDVRRRLSELRTDLQEPVRADRGRISGRLDPRIDPRLAPVPDPLARTTRPREIRPETIEMLRRAGQVDQLAPPGFDSYSLHMESAQQHMTSGRFFDAEDRFTAALSARPGDPMAAIGRIHAELGAGMYISAAINLRDLLIANPELAAVRYSPDLLPSRERLQNVVERLDELIQSRPDRQRENGMLLAYIGFQTRNPDAVRRGLAAMDGAGVGGEPMAAADEQMIRLAALLREVWQNPEMQQEGR